jgi:Fe-S cluster assembly protein SufD
MATATAKKLVDKAITIPTTKWEKWKYTSLKEVEAHLNTAPDLTHARNLIASDLPALPTAFGEIAGRLILVDGIFRDDLSTLPNGFTISAEHAFDVSDEDQPLLHLNAMHAHEGMIITIPAKSRFEAPLVIQHVSTGTISSAPRLTIKAETQCEAVIVEIWQGQTDSTNNGVNNTAINVVVEKAATLHHYRWQNETADTTHLTTSTITVERDASYDSFVLTTGAKLARQDSTAHMVGENCECRLNGVYLLADKQHQDTTILVHHKAPHGRSNQTFKGIIDDHAKAVFQGKVFVHRGAQKTDGYQLNNALLLSNTAEVDVKPELEIYADDVKCSHGATTGQIDTGPLFYLRSRGLSEAQARLLLMQAFVGPALEEIRNDNVREIFSEITLNWLQDHVA